MDRQTLVKFIFLVIVGVGVIVYGVYSIFGNDKNDEENIEDMFIPDEEIEVGSFDELDLDDLDFNSLDIDLDDENDEDNKNDDGNTEDYDFEKQAIKLLGENKVQKSKELAIDVVTMWLEEEPDLDKWNKKVTKDVLKYVESHVFSSTDGVKRVVDKVDVFVVDPSSKEEIILEVVPTFYFDIDGELFERQQKLFYITVKIDDKNYVVKELVEL